MHYVGRADGIGLGDMDHNTTLAVADYVADKAVPEVPRQTLMV